MGFDFVYPKEVRDLLDKFENLKIGCSNEVILKSINDAMIRLKEITIPMILIKKTDMLVW